MINYEKLMKKCINLAKKGRGKTAPNPLVGCVVLDKNNEIISTGYHHKYGENHAERDALLKLTDGSEKDGTLVVNLEPCSHYGKTPPCADLIIERGLKKVVIGCIDDNPKVAGNGIKKLKNAGIEVVLNVLEKECRELNEIFFTNIEEQRTFVALKTATTIDGKIATKIGDSKWITSDKSRNYARKLRTYYDAILTSSNTVIADNPTMKHKTKIILDRNLRTDWNSDIYKQGQIILVTSEDYCVDEYPLNFEVLLCPEKNGKLDLNYILKELYTSGIKSIFVEAGGKLCGEFVKENLVDKVYHFIAPKILNDNSGRSCFDGDNILKINDSKNFKLIETKTLGSDILITYKI
ncbi:TPA: riboflavin biosynthesis protein RibD [Candidatus Gastranaerophilales bacterium HUM_9]|nr:MAG TPA: riboflavin biosynthesis protein RibD [Candidatus Gastranaerophilales bacterium HUM_9]HBX34392.1 bifunctional diaminohydroxyphosphoribosylaminopyrimidine deaminase/5-amino-6-(5-phosphoribosylamino)uracil reductase RibD [Cyanobacteria bacterium UBA11440]